MKWRESWLVSLFLVVGCGSGETGTATETSSVSTEASDTSAVTDATDDGGTSDTDSGGDGEVDYDEFIQFVLSD